MNAAPSPALAYWTGIQGGNYNWGDNNGTTCNWSSDLAGSASTSQLPGGTTDVVFAADNASSASLTDNLETAYTINSLTVLGSGPAAGSPVTIGGSGAGASLTINAAASAVGGEGYSASTGIVLQSGAAGLTISTPGGVILPAVQSWTNNSSGTLRVSSNVSGAPSDNSPVTLALINTSTGGTTISGVISDGTGSGSPLGLYVMNTGSPATLLTGNNTFSGGTIMSSGAALQVGNGGSTGSLGSGAIIDNGDLEYNLNSAGAVSLPAAGVSGSGSLGATAGTIAFNGNVNLGGSQSYTQAGGPGQGQGLSVLANTTLSAAIISLTGDVGEGDSGSGQYSLSLNSGSSITLNISLGASGVFNQLSSFSATSTGYAPINVNGTGPSGGGWNNTPVTLTGPVLISANVNSNASVTILPNGTPYGTVSGQLSGSMPLVVVGSGTLTLANPNTYSGGTAIVVGGTLAAGNVQSLGSNTVSLDGGTLSLQATSTPPVVNQQPLNVAGFNIGVIVPITAATQSSPGWPTATLDSTYNLYQAGWNSANYTIGGVSPGTFTERLQQ